MLFKRCSGPNYHQKCPKINKKRPGPITNILSPSSVSREYLLFFQEFQILLKLGT